MLLGSYSEKGQIVLWIDIAYHTASLGGQLLQQTSILSGGRVVQRGLDGYTLVVDHYEADDALVGRDSFYGFLHFGLF